MKDLILGSHIFFAREGDVIDGITVAVDAKPDTDPETNWTKLGCVEQYEPKNDQQFIDRRCPSPGRFRTRKRIPINQKMTLNFSIQEWDEMALAELLHNADKPVGGVFTPNSRTEALRGWIKVQAYDQNDQLILSMDVWAEANIDSYQFGEKLDPYALQLEVLHSDLNEGALTNI